MVVFGLGFRRVRDTKAKWTETSGPRKKRKFSIGGERDMNGDRDVLVPRCVLEDFTRCSDSLLWKLMMSFYDRKGVESWSQGIVPHFITCNAFIGRTSVYALHELATTDRVGAYAKVLLGFLRDCKQPNAKLPLDSSEPLYIVELGAGSGKFSFFMLKVRERHYHDLS
jgi:hypothetical protein